MLSVKTTSIGGVVDLNVYCAADCRNLVNRATIACDDGDDPDGAAAFTSLTGLLCTTDADNVNCFDFLSSPQFEALTDAADMSGACPDEIPPGQMCSPACQTAVSKFCNRWRMLHRSIALILEINLLMMMNLVIY